MATAAYRTLPPVGVHGHVAPPANYGMGPLTTHHAADDVYHIKQQPKYYLRDKYDNQIVRTQNGQPRSTGANYSNAHDPYASSTDRHAPNLPHQIPDAEPGNDPPVTTYHLLSPSESNFLQSTQEVPNYPSKSSPMMRRRSISQSDRSFESNGTARRNPRLADIQKSQAGAMRAGPVGRPNYGNPTPNNQRNSQWQAGGYSSPESGPTIKYSASNPNYRQNRRDDFSNEENFSSFDEYNNDLRPKRQSRRRADVPQTTRQYNSSLPPVRRGQGPSHQAPNLGQALAPGHPLQGRFGRQDGYASDPHSSTYSPNTDSRKGKSQIRRVATQDYEGENAHQNHDYGYAEHQQYEHAPQHHRNVVQEAPHLQQSLSTNSYVENQRRRALRDSQGYYFPYKKYTLRDYKDLQRTESQYNPYGSDLVTGVDRRALVTRRSQYAARIEKPAVDTNADDYRTPRDFGSRKAPYLSYGANYDPEKAAKRNRALEYVKVQVAKHRPKKVSKHRHRRIDPTEEYVNGLFPEIVEFRDDDDDDEEEAENGPNGHTAARREVHTETNANHRIPEENDDEQPT